MPENFIPQRRNANKHTQRGLRLLEQSVQRDGFIDAQTAAADGEIISGSARLELSAEKFSDVEPIIVESDGSRPVIVVRKDIPNADDPRAKRLSVAANQIARTDFDPDGDLLKEWGNEDKHIREMFSDAEWTEVTGEEKPTKDAQPQVDRAAELLEKWQVKTGDLWQIGEHRLVCGDCTDAAVVARVISGDTIDMVFTDPPYGVDYEYADTKDDPKEYEKLANGFWDACPVAPLKMLTVGHKWNNFWFSKNPQGFLVWFDKTKQSPSNVAHLCKSELILIFGKVYERFAWDTLEIQQPRDDGLRELHTCPKPLELWQKIIEVQKGAETVYEPFSGSGTTLVACQNLARRCRAIEISPAYVAVALERMATAFPELSITRLE